MQKATINQLLRKRSFENVPTLHFIENLLVKKRKYIFKMPKRGEPALVLLSGGLDSVATAHILIEKYGLQIFPLFIKRKQQRTAQELASAKFYVSELQKKYGDLCQDLFVLNSPIPPTQIRRVLALHSNDLTGYDQFNTLGLPVYLLSLAACAVQFACYIELTKKIHLRTIFISYVSSDGVALPYQTLTALRSTTLSTCLLQNDFSWQITSYALEKELNHFLDKSDLLRWCSNHEIDLTKTWSCYFPFKYHCGECNGCAGRKRSYSKARVKDVTIYKNPSTLTKKIYKISQRIHEKFS